MKGEKWEGRTPQYGPIPCTYIENGTVPLFSGGSSGSEVIETCQNTEQTVLWPMLRKLTQNLQNLFLRLQFLVGQSLYQSYVCLCPVFF